jgi:hypothetical protein
MTTNTENASTMLASTQQLRTHWSGVITTHLTVAFTVNIALWSYFLKSYFEAEISGSPITNQYLFSVSALSSIIISLWRLYTRYIDNHIAGLYPDFLLYEGMLKVPTNRSTCKYLSDEVPHVGKILNSKNVEVERRVEFVSQMVAERRMGDRGHWWIDVVMLFIILVMTAGTIWIACPYTTCYLVGNVIALVVMVWAMTGFQRNPTEKFADKVAKQCNIDLNDNATKTGA